MTDRQSYDPYRLIDDVEGLLRQRGYQPERLEGHVGDRVAGASRLLRGLGIEALRSSEDAVNLDGSASYESRMHGD